MFLPNEGKDYLVGVAWGIDEGYVGGGCGATLFVGDASLEVLADGTHGAVLTYTVLTQEADMFALAGLGQTADRMD